MDISEGEKTNLFIDHLYRLRFPKWNKKRSTIKSISDSIKSKTGLDINPPEFIEGNTIDISFTVKSIDDLDNVIKNISTFKSEIEKILEQVKE